MIPSSAAGCAAFALGNGPSAPPICTVQAMRLAAAFCAVLLLCSIDGSIADIDEGRCSAARSVLGATSTPAVASAARRARASKKVFLVPTPKVAAATISAATLALDATAAAQPMAYATAVASSAAPEEFAFDSAVAAGKLSSVAGEGVNYVTLKIQFKRPVNMADLVTTSEFDKPFVGSQLARGTFSAAVQLALGPGSVVDLVSERPSYSTPLLNVVDRAIAVTAEENPAFGLDVQQNTTLSDGVGHDLAFYQSADNRATATFTPGLWWTFAITDRSDLGNYRFQGVKWINAERLTNSQPFQMSLKVASTGEFLYSLDIWNKAVAAGYLKKHCLQS